MLNVGRLNEGVVLDHIKAGKCMTIYKDLKLDKLDCCVALIKNARSKKMGRKDIIKVECPIDTLNLDILGFIDHTITVNIIKDGEIVQKKELELPKQITNVIQCRNPRCITSIARVSVVMKGNEVSFRQENARFEIGERDNTVISPQVQAVKNLFDRANIKCIVPKDMVYDMWHKFMCNVSENQSAAILGIPFGAWVVSEHANAIREAAMREVVAIANKKGIPLSEEDIVAQRKVFPRIPYENKPSTLQDIEAGRKTEVDIFAGAVIRMGKEVGVETPLNEFFYHGIRVLEEKNEGVI